MSDGTNIKDILKGKSEDEIKADMKKRLESDKDFQNKDFLQMVAKFHPDKFDHIAFTVLPIAAFHLSIFELVNELMKGKILNCDGPEHFKATITCFELCGVHPSQIEFKHPKEKGKDDIDKIFNYRFTIKTTE